MDSEYATEENSQIGPQLWTFLLPRRRFSFIGMEMSRYWITFAQPGAFRAYSREFLQAAVSWALHRRFKSSVTAIRMI